jgi:undecaprenyl-phosphate 4-deoxy-4-formamido-L-arabinose transferase
MSSLAYSIVVPVYRGEATVVELCNRLVAFFEGRATSFEILLVDDGSSDGSWNRIQELAGQDDRIAGLRLTRNFGQHNATVCGFRHARGEFVITIDEDLQFPPEEIGKLIDRAERDGSDVVYGVPEQRRHSWWRRLGSRMVMIVPRLVMKVPFDISSFRLIRGPISAEVAKAQRHDIVIDVMVSWITDRISAVRVQQMESTARKSSYTPAKLLQVLFNILYNYTVLPLRFSILIGGALSLLSLVLAAYFVYVRVTQDVGVPGFSALIVSILFSTGVILLGIGMMSEYLAHTFLHVIRKPQSVVRETTARK